MEAVLQAVGDHVDFWLGIGGLGATGLALHCLYAGGTSIWPWAEESPTTESEDQATIDLEEGQQESDQEDETPSNKLKLEEVMEKPQAEVGWLEAESPCKRKKVQEPVSTLTETDSSAKSSQYAPTEEPCARPEFVAIKTTVDLVIGHDAVKWLEAFKGAGDGTKDPDMETIRFLRQQVWRQTLAIIEGEDFSGYTQVLKAPDLRLHSLQPQGQRAKVQVVQQDMLEEAVRLSKCYSVAVLNMASPWKPGGGVFSGAGAQEETIFRRTNLASYLHQKFYPLEEKCLVSHGVLVLRGSEQRGYPVLEAKDMCQVTFLSCAAPSRSQALL